jgi:hypothetical protein
VLRKDGSDDGSPPEDWRGEPRNNAAHESKRDRKSRLYRKSNTAPALLSYLGDVLTDSRSFVAQIEAAGAHAVIPPRSSNADQPWALGKLRRPQEAVVSLDSGPTLNLSALRLADNLHTTRIRVRCKRVEALNQLRFLHIARRRV